MLCILFCGGFILVWFVKNNKTKQADFGLKTVYIIKHGTCGLSLSANPAEHCSSALCYCSAVMSQTISNSSSCELFIASPRAYLLDICNLNSIITAFTSLHEKGNSQKGIYAIKILNLHEHWKKYPMLETAELLWILKKYFHLRLF